MTDKFIKELTELINKHSIENISNTPDFVLADYIVGCLQVFECAVKQRGFVNIKNAVTKAMKEKTND